MRINILGFIRRWDIFGHPIKVNHHGEDSHKTLLGAFVTCAVFALLLQNLINLSTAFLDGSKQFESNQLKLFDRHNSTEYNLADNGIEIAIVTGAINNLFYAGLSTVPSIPLTPDIGKFIVNQVKPCD